MRPNQPTVLNRTLVILDEAMVARSKGVGKYTLAVSPSSRRKGAISKENFLFINQVQGGYLVTYPVLLRLESSGMGILLRSYSLSTPEYSNPLISDI